MTSKVLKTLIDDTKSRRDGFAAYIKQIKADIDDAFADRMFGYIKELADKAKQADADMAAADADLFDLIKQYAAAKKSEHAAGIGPGLSVIDDFLAGWKAKAVEFYIGQMDRLVELSNAYKDTNPAKFDNGRRPWPFTPIESQAARGYDKLSDVEKAAFDAARRFYLSHNKGTWRFLYDNAWSHNGRVIVLDEKLDKEVANKRRMLIGRIEKKAGNIIDAAGLSIGVNGEINGTVIGDIGTVKVNTIYAGGYNIQCLHYRVLVK